MSIQDEVAVLRRIPLFARIEPAKLKLLAFTSDRVTYEQDQVLFNQGDEGDAAFVIIDGEADILVDTPQGSLSVAKVQKNDFVGEIAILCEVPRTATVKALSRLDTLRIDKEQFFKLMSEFPELSVEVMRVLAQRLADTTEELADARKQLRGQS